MIPDKELCHKEYFSSLNKTLTDYSVIAILECDGGKSVSRNLTDLSIIARSDCFPRIQEV
ncbi:hypothetical protein MFUM_870020 [Methylacidiphilum fumariolicum SolV]|uniref:Uncharacterized protein n=2 Tax=Candidatus Methylacidiphilum fumarolicum TaxID=591154 RepID=I0K0C0_METFB|nr:conserved protein of unknown function [Candidatus Methylacidiphilum fumarolicum]CCG92939.1 hypothetical protein MFUM_870020 [Methylacidiphilum fumariolicum SolV]